MHIETPSKKVAKNNKEVFDFFVVIENFEKLMPDNTDTFEVLDEKTFRFALKGMPEIILRRKEEFPYSKVVFGAASDKLPFTLTFDIEGLDNEESNVTLVFQGKFNAMMAMMIKGPITKFMETLSHNMDAI